MRRFRFLFLKLYASADEFSPLIPFLLTSLRFDVTLGNRKPVNRGV